MLTVWRNGSGSPGSGPRQPGPTICPAAEAIRAWPTSGSRVALIVRQPFHRQRRRSFPPKSVGAAVWAYLVTHCGGGTISAAGGAAAVLPAAPFEPGDDANGRILLAGHLAAQTNTGQASGGQQRLLGSGHRRGLTRDELHPAGGAAGLPPTGVQLIGLRLFTQGQNQPLALGHLKRSDSLNGQLGHEQHPREQGPETRDQKRENTKRGTREGDHHRRQPTGHADHSQSPVSNQ